MLQAAEAAGFYGYHLTEHHATPLSMTPSPSIFLAAAARETRRIRLGTLLYLLPLYHPLRLLEELCMLDHLSGGRLDIGVGRGISPMEFDAFDVDFERSGSDYEHAFNVLYQGFTRDRLDYTCDRYTFKDVLVVIRLLQRPHPLLLVRIARRSRPGVRRTPRHARGHARAGREGCEDACDLPRAVGDPWRGPQARAPRSRPAPRRDACDVHRRHRCGGRAHRAAGLQALVRQPAWLWVERGTFPPISISADYDQSKNAGTLVVGSPDTVRRILTAQAERIGQNYLVLLLAFGSLTHTQEMHSLSLFAREVMPTLASMNREEAPQAAALATAS